jgi:hypothetical protein
VTLPASCPTPDQCELTGCESGACKRRALATTPEPIPLHLKHLSAEERGHGLVRLTEKLQRLIRRQPEPPPSEPFTPLLEDLPVTDYPAPDTIVVSLAPPSETPPEVPPAAPAPAKVGPTTPLQVLPVRFGGFVLIGERGPIAVALDAKGLAAVLQRWANGEMA